MDHGSTEKMISKIMESMDAVVQQISLLRENVDLHSNDRFPLQQWTTHERGAALIEATSELEKACQAGRAQYISGPKVSLSITLT